MTFKKIRLAELMSWHYGRYVVQRVQLYH
jgi:hypothetical protein